jgi:RNA polymerase sigma factor (sigma-70 family)
LYNETWHKIRTGDQQALVLLYKSMYQYLLNTGARFIKDTELLKDLIQELFLEIWEQHERLPEVQHVKAYLATAYRNRLINVLKKTPQLAIVNEEDIDLHIAESPYLEKLLDYQQDEARRARLAASLQQLTARQLQLLEMRFYLQMDYEEMEAALGISRKTIYNIVFRALEILREQMVSNG